MAARRFSSSASAALAPRGGLEVGTRRLAAAARVGQGVAQPAVRGPRASRCGRAAELEGAAVEPRGVVEGQALGGAVGGPGVVLGAAWSGRAAPW